MRQKQTNSSSYSDSIKALEVDIQHANTLAASLPRDHDALSTYLGLLHVLIFNVYADGMPSISTKERRATIKEFYAVIYPSLRLLEGEFSAHKSNDQRSSNCKEVVTRKRLEKLDLIDKDEEEEEEECGICMEKYSMKTVLPNCGHSLCIGCFHDWYMRSESCPFCRGSLKRLTPRDLWVVIGNSDVVDSATIAKENLRRLYLFLETLPQIVPAETHLLSTFNYLL